MDTLTHRGRVFYLFGFPIAHSLSPLVHNAVFKALGIPWKYILFPTTVKEDILPMMRKADCLGAAVTMPHKVSIMSELDELSEEGRDVGACNTISLQERHGRRVYVGTNTDVVGIREAFFQNVTDPTGLFFDRPGLVIGGGGAARSAVYTMRRWMRCSPIYIVNRDKSEVDAVISSFKGKRWAGELIPVDSCKDAQRLEAPGAIVSCIPDFPPKTPKEHETREVIMTMLNKPHKGAILEMCYHPAPWTAIAEISAEAGWQVILGTEAMIWQALEQQRLWTGRPLNDMPVKEVKGLVAKAISDPLAPRHKL